MPHKLCFSWSEVCKLHPMTSSYDNWVEKENGEQRVLRAQHSTMLEENGNGVQMGQALS